MKERKLIILGTLLIFIAVVFAYYLIRMERERHMVLQEPDSSAQDLEATDLKQQSMGEQVVELYFYNPGRFPSDPDFLVPEERVIYQIADRTLMARQILLELFRGPQRRAGEAQDEISQDPLAAGLKSPALPPGARLRQVFILEDGTAVVDLDSDTANNIEGAFYEYVAVQAVTRSLVDNLKDVTQVRFLVEGKEQDTLAGHLSISHPFRVK